MNRSFLLATAALLAATFPVRAASPCDTVVAASMKVLQVPTHLFMTVTGGRSSNSETIYFNGVTYIKVQGQWQKSAFPVKPLAESKKEMEDRMGTCSVVRDEILGGEPATLFKVRNKSEDAADVQM